MNFCFFFFFLRRKANAALDVKKRYMAFQNIMVILSGLELDVKKRYKDTEKFY